MYFSFNDDVGAGLVPALSSGLAPALSSGLAPALSLSTIRDSTEWAPTRGAPTPKRICLFNKSPAAVFFKGLFQLFLSIHNYRSIPCNRLIQGFA